MDLMAEIFIRTLYAARLLVGAAFVLGLLVALTHWLVREQKIAAFGGWARFVRKWSDPLLRPIERKLVGAGGNPQHAPWWLLAVVVVGGLILIELLQWLMGFVVNTAYAFSSGPNFAVFWALNLVFSLLMFALLVRVFSSWFGAGRYNKWIRWSYQLTDWLVEPLRRVLPPFGMLDLSPLAAYLVLWLLRRLLMGAMF
jgi:YggT family protein